MILPSVLSRLDTSRPILKADGPSRSVEIELSAFEFAHLTCGEIGYDRGCAMVVVGTEERISYKPRFAAIYRARFELFPDLTA